VVSGVGWPRGRALWLLGASGPTIGKIAVNRLFTVAVGPRYGEDGDMPKPEPDSPLSVYQLRVVLRGISPLIWRRLLVRSDATLAELHAVLQVAFSW